MALSYNVSVTVKCIVVEIWKVILVVLSSSLHFASYLERKDCVHSAMKGYDTQSMILGSVRQLTLGLRLCSIGLRD